MHTGNVFAISIGLDQNVYKMPTVAGFDILLKYQSRALNEFLVKVNNYDHR